jgi:hypothetical protein
MLSAAAAVIATQTPAYADGTSYSTDGHASAVFQSYGEHFTVHDLSADGHSGVGVIEYASDSGGWIVLDVLWNTNGYSGSAVSKNYSLPEGLYVRYHACIGEKSTNSAWNCGGWVYDHA